LLTTGKRDANKSMGFNFDSGGYVCHKCGAHGFCGGLVDEINLYERAESEFVEQNTPPAAEEPRWIEPCQGFIALGCEPGSSSLMTAWARDYLERRGVPEQTIAEVGIGCCISGKNAGRVVVPHLADFKRPGDPWLGWIGRDAGVSGAPLDPKYRYNVGLKRDVLWHHDALGDDTDTPLILVEGVFDALPLWPIVAAFLAKPTKSHLAALSAHRGRPLVMALDGDARDQSWALAMRLRHAGAPVYYLRIPAGWDPCELDCVGVLDLLVRQHPTLGHAAIAELNSRSENVEK
jgi:hypothetical protein